MEDVFIKVGDADEAAVKAKVDNKSAGEAVHAQKNVDVNRNSPVGLPRFESLTGSARICRQFKGLFLKRFHALRREWASSLHYLIWPVVFLAAYGAGMEKLAHEGEISKYSIRSLMGKSQGFIAGKLNDFVSSARDRFAQDGVRFNTHLEDSETAIEAFLLKLYNESELEYRTKWSVGLSNSKLWFNGEAKHMGGAALARWQSFAMSKIMGNKSKVDVSSWPFFVRTIGRLEIDILLARMTASIMMPAVFAYMACPAITYPVTERVSKSKLIQLMTGVNPVLFHGANFCFDFWYQTMFAGILLGYFRYLNPGGCFSYHSEILYALIALFLSHNVAMISFSYFLAMFCTDSIAALTAFINMTTIPTGVAAAIFAMCEALRGFLKFGFLENLPLLLRIASLHPTFSAVWGTTSIVLNALTQKICKFPDQETHQIQCAITYLPSCCQPCKNDSSKVCYEYQSSFSMDPVSGIGYQLTVLCFFGIICMILVISSECNWRSVNNAIEISRELTRKAVVNPQTTMKSTAPVIYENTRDSDVVEEEQVVERIVKERKMALHTLVARRLKRYFGSLKAVDGISFHLTGNECFGLLGTNGAGKTTTFSMLTGDVSLSEGDAFIKEHSINASLHNYRREIGYCPQFDALQATLTGRELLELFCALRAIPKRESAAVIQSLTKLVDIVPHVDKTTEMYSGGNKRKLSLAIALVGNPTILLLDEPTAGVDPSARRKIYSALAQSQKNLNTAIILTSHSIEVCEALCQRVAIMVAGTFRCLGPTQHLKSKYGSGFTVQIKLEKVDENTGVKLARVMSDIFGGKCSLKQSYMTLFQFHVNDLSLKWSELFEKVQKLRENSAFTLEDIQVSDTTLEELFLAFGKAESDEQPLLPSST